MLRNVPELLLCRTNKPVAMTEIQYLRRMALMQMRLVILFFISIIVIHLYAMRQNCKNICVWKKLGTW